MNRIGDYALIGDCHSAALVGRDASIDWTCWPRFDSPSVFGRILDAEAGGSFDVIAADQVESGRYYIEDTNVLVTWFACRDGRVEITDCMPVTHEDHSDPFAIVPNHSILRRIGCTEGSITVQARVAPRFEYGSFTPRFRLLDERTGSIVGGSDSMLVRATAPLGVEDNALTGSWTLSKGEHVWIEASWFRAHLMPQTEPPEDGEYAEMLERTISFWKRWLRNCWYDGDHPGEVHRSALALKALTYAPSGAVIAAPTTSLPEEIGGLRNWDYRYTWIRDATLTVISLYILGFTEEADAFKGWMERTGAGRCEDLQIMYGVTGKRALPEIELEHLAGHRGSRPVRIGNGAAEQVQLDAYGQILESAYLFGRGGGLLTEANWKFLSGLADIVSTRWREADNGIWEMRDDPRHFVHSKLHCWLALHRGAQIAEVLGLSAISGAWSAERDLIRSYLMEHAAPEGWFHQAVGSPVADASTLLIPAVGFLPTSHPYVQKTMEKVMESLTHDGLVYRYVSDDGLAGGEGAFLLCSFWLLDCLTHSNRLAEAEALLERLLGLANDVGLFSEEVDVSTGEALGNFPQAFTHMALVQSCAHLSAAKRGRVPFEGAHNYAELALERLLADRGQAAGGELTQERARD